MKLYRLITALMVSIPLFAIAQQDETYAKVVEADKYGLGIWQVYPDLLKVGVWTTCISKGDIWPSTPICSKGISILYQDENTGFDKDRVTDVSEQMKLSVAGKSGTTEEVYELLRQQDRPVIRIGTSNIAVLVELRDFTRVADTIYERELTAKSEEVTSQRAKTAGFILLGLFLMIAGFYFIRKCIEVVPRLATKVSRIQRELQSALQSTIQQLWMRKVVKEEIYRQMTRDAMAEVKSAAEGEALRKQIKLAREGGNHDLAATLEAALKRIDN